MHRFFYIAMIVAISVLMTSHLHAERNFAPLFQLSVKGQGCLVKLPGQSSPVPAKDNKAYPYGTRVITSEGTATVFLSKNDQIMLSNNTTIDVIQPAERENRTIVIINGKIKTYLMTEAVPDGTPLSNVFSVESTVARCDKITGTVNYEVARSADTTIMKVTTEDGNAQISGPQFTAPKLPYNTTAQITSANDNTFTTLKCVEGDCRFLLEKGNSNPLSIKVRADTLIKIWRKRTLTTNNLVAAVQVSKTSGKVSHFYTFSEGNPPEDRLVVAGKTADDGDPTEDSDEKLPELNLDPVEEKVKPDTEQTDDIFDFL